MYDYCYDPEIDLWCITDPKGYVVDWEVFKHRAVYRVRKLNEFKNKCDGC